MARVRLPRPVSERSPLLTCSLASKHCGESLTCAYVYFRSARSAYAINKALLALLFTAPTSGNGAYFYIV